MANRNRKNHAAASAEKRRALNPEELQLAETARQRAMSRLTNRMLSEVVRRLPSHRDRARDLSDRQGREARSKAAPAGATPASGNAGTPGGHDHLDAALERATEESKAGGRKPGDDTGAEPGDDTETDPGRRDHAARARTIAAAPE